MSIDKINIPAFEGFNGNLRADLIKDSQASEIVNLRFNRLGALVNRNGSVAYNIPFPVASVSEGIDNKGCVGIGEFIISGIDNNSMPGRGLNTDRFMVYALRRSGIDGSDTLLPTQHTMVYLMCPITGAYRNRLTSNSYSHAFSYKISANGDQYPIQLLAPRRQLYNLDEWQSSSGELYDQNWIEHYVIMNQYGDVLVISDRVNGDTIIVDEYNEAEPGTSPDHAYRLQDNVKATFNIDDVVIDFGLSTAGFNGKGVKNGLGLYQYYLPRKNALINNDNYAGYWNVSDDTIKQRLDNVGGQGGLAADPLAVVKLSQAGTFMVAGAAFDWVEGDDIFSGARFALATGLGVNQSNDYTFSDIDESVEIDDLHGQLSFVNPLSTDKEEKASDVYVWEDVEMMYYPCSGKEANSSYLRAKDRDFTKTAPLLPKLEKLTTKLGLEQNVPVSVWRYRFVWDMGNGEYSNPSAEMSIPDTLWSTIKDNDLTIALADNDTHADYERPIKQTVADIITQPIAAKANQVNLTNVDAAPLLFDVNYNLTAYGFQFKKIKDVLYAGVNHRFSDLSPVPPTTTPANYALRSEYGVTTTAKFGSGGNQIDCKGTIFESAFWNRPKEDNSFEEIVKNRYPLKIPLFRGDFQETYNSVFDDTGAYRVAWQNKPEYGAFYSTLSPAWQIVLWEETVASKNKNFTSDMYFRTGTDKVPGIYFNVVPLRGTWQKDKNNAPEPSSGLDGATLSSYRMHTQFRGIKKEADRLINIAQNIPVQVTSRLLLRGTSELVLADAPLPGTITNATDPKQGEILGHDTVRNFRSIKEGLVTPSEKYWFYNGTDSPADHSGGYYGQTNVVDGVRYIYNTNVTVAIHGDGERLTIPEQLTAYFPASLLFQAPRVKLKIAASKIPVRAKRLMIFRTLASHDNNWQHDKFGLVKAVKISKEEDGTIKDFEFLDDVKSKDLDFGVSLDEFQGLTHPLKSRFNLPLNETMYYANFIETYQPPAPRSRKEIVDGGVVEYYADNSTTRNITSYTHNVFWTRLSGASATSSRNVLYALLNKDPSGIYSAPAFVGSNIDNDAPISVHAGQAVVLISAPQASGLTDEVEVWRGTELSQYNYRWELIGSIDKGMEGIYMDDEREPIALWSGAIEETFGRIMVDPDEVENPSGLRNSEPYSPNFVRLTSLYPVRSGDGDKITGMEQLAGNLLIFKERSIHRIAIQSSNPPYSRTDEISNVIGCIAPNTVLQYNNDIYFLSWSGFYRFNNNVLQKADGDFWAELERRINNFGTSLDEFGNPRNPAVRDASCGYNPVFNEIYLNVPIYTHGGSISPDVEKVNDSRKMLGHIYVLQLDTGLVTKFHYEQGGDYPDRTQGRLYHTNSLGEMRSAQILSDDIDTKPALVCIDAPTEVHKDSISTNSLVGAEYVFDTKDIHSLWRSKAFTTVANQNDKSVVKRVAKVLANVRKGSYIRISGGSQNEDYGSYLHETDRWWEFDYDTTGELTAVPPRTSSAPNTSTASHPERGERFGIQIDSDNETMIDYVAIHWRPVNQYMR